MSGATATLAVAVPGRRCCDLLERESFLAPARLSVLRNSGLGLDGFRSGRLQQPFQRPPRKGPFTYLNRDDERVPVCRFGVPPIPASILGPKPVDPRPYAPGLIPQPPPNLRFGQEHFGDCLVVFLWSTRRNKPIRQPFKPPFVARPSRPIRGRYNSHGFPCAIQHVVGIPPAPSDNADRSNSADSLAWLRAPVYSLGFSPGHCSIRPDPLMILFWRDLLSMSRLLPSFRLPFSAIGIWHLDAHVPSPVFAPIELVH